MPPSEMNGGASMDAFAVSCAPLIPHLDDEVVEGIFHCISVSDRETQKTFGLICKQFLSVRRRFMKRIIVQERSLIPHLRSIFPSATSVCLHPIQTFSTATGGEEDTEETLRRVNTILDPDLILLATNFPSRQRDLRELFLVQSDFWPHDCLTQAGLAVLGHFRKLRTLHLVFSYGEAGWGPGLFDLGADGWAALSTACSQMEHLRELKLAGLEDYYSPLCGQVSAPLFASCMHLRTLTIEDCKLRLDLHSLGSCRRLKRLQVLSWSHLRMEEIREAADCRDLRELDLRWRPAAAVDPNPTLVDVISCCTRLEKLSIRLRVTSKDSSRSLDPTLDAAISSLPDLRAMEIAAFMPDCTEESA